MTLSKFAGYQVEFLSLLAYGASRLGPRHLRPKFTENIENRAAKYLSLLGSPANTLRFQVAIRNLERENDLLWEHGLGSPSAMRLQALVLKWYAEMKLERNPQLGNLKWDPPLYALFGAIMEQAIADRATAIRVHFHWPDDPRIVVEYVVLGESKVVLWVPKAFRLDWVLRLAAAVGYHVLRPAVAPFARHNLLPERANVGWKSPTLCEIRLD